MFSIIIILFVLYFPPLLVADSEQPHEHHPHHTIRSPSEILHSEYSPPTYRTAVSVTAANAIYFMLGAIISLVFLAKSPKQARILAAWLGVISMVLAVVQYVPQLWVTWRIKVSPSPVQR